MFPTLRIGDGFAGIALSKRQAVQTLQQALANAGYAIDTDGCFGPGTQEVVVTFQRESGIDDDGVVGQGTWTRLKPHLPPASLQIAEQHRGTMEGFRGDLEWVHEWEGHAGRPYWPGGQSGVTLDPGFDLAHQNMDTLRRFYVNLTFEQQDRLETVFGLSGDPAKRALAKHNLNDIRVSYTDASNVMPLIADRYWQKLCQRFTGLDQATTPACVQTVMLSLGYNRGTGNRALTPLEAMITNQQWKDMGDEIGAMQQEHKLAGIRRRRREEGLYIHDHLASATSGEPTLSLSSLFNTND